MLGEAEHEIIINNQILIMEFLVALSGSQQVTRPMKERLEALKERKAFYDNVNKKHPT